MSDDDPFVAAIDRLERARDARPERWTVDPIRTPDALLAGWKMVEGQAGAGLEDIIWALIVEAAKTERAIRPPGPNGYRSAFPEVYHTEAEIFATETSMAGDNITYEPRVTLTATAAELARFCEVTTWLRFVGGRDVAKTKRVVWALARRQPSFAVARREGYGSSRGVLAQCDRAMLNIADRLKREIPRLGQIFY